MSQTESTSWSIPDVKIQPGRAGRQEVDVEKHKNLVLKVKEVAERNNWTKSDVSKRTGIPNGTFSQWFSFKYSGRLDKTNQKVQNWLDNLERTQTVAANIPISPSFIQLSISDELINLFKAAQTMPAMTMACAEAGMGKTTTGRYYKSITANTFLVTISPHTRTVHACLNEIAAAIGVDQPNQAKLFRAIGERLKRSGHGTLLIVDEAQNLIDDAVNQLRHLTDLYDCGITLMGNSHTYTRFSNWASGEAKYAQLHRRIFKRIKKEKPTLSDLNKFIKAWDIEDENQIKFLRGVGMKPGALGQIDMTVKLARLATSGGNRNLTLQDLRAAWETRNVDVV